MSERACRGHQVALDMNLADHDFKFLEDIITYVTRNAIQTNSR